MHVVMLRQGIWHVQVFAVNNFALESKQRLTVNTSRYRYLALSDGTHK